MRKINVLIIDDSALVRQSLTALINEDPRLNVCGTASDPYFAARAIQKKLPDVITLDIQMPRMDGLTFLRKLMAQKPIPVVVISSLSGKGTSAAIQAYDYGAKEVIGKPRMNTRNFMDESRIIITDAIVAAALSDNNIQKASVMKPVEQSHNADVILQRSVRPQEISSEKIIAIGASTGGPKVIADILESVPAESHGIVIVQHMPEQFTNLFAQRIDQISQLNVREARAGDVVERGIALIAPGDKHMLLRRVGDRYKVELKQGPLVNRHRPSVDVLFRSVAEYAGENAIGILLTGMGEDGARGLLEMRESGAKTIAQDEASSIVFGMPHKAIQLNAAQKIWDPERISAYINKTFRAVGVESSPLK